MNRASVIIQSMIASKIICAIKNCKSTEYVSILVNQQAANMNKLTVLPYPYSVDGVNSLRFFSVYISFYDHHSFREVYGFFFKSKSESKRERERKVISEVMLIVISN